MMLLTTSKVNASLNQIRHFKLSYIWSKTYLDEEEEDVIVRIFHS